VTVAEIEALLFRLYIDADGAKLRKEDRKKALELGGLATEIALSAGRLARSGELVVVDAAAGKRYVAVLAAALLAPAHAVLIERDPRRLALAEEAAVRSGIADVRFSFHSGDVGDPTLWPPRPDVVVALHACGRAADAILDAAVAASARLLLLAPCCIPTEERHTRRAEETGIPRHAAVRRAFLDSLIAAERTLRLERAGYHTEIVAFVPPTVTPHNLLWRARRIGDPNRMRKAQAQLRQIAAI
jgi:hypothetical protein